jgi:hypothetical protein
MDEKRMKDTLKQLANKWRKVEQKYREQVEEARRAGTPAAGMQAHADQLRECRTELEKVLESES